MRQKRSGDVEKKGFNVDRHTEKADMAGGENEYQRWGMSKLETNRKA